ncbi:hypothetical protein SLEP1_g5759 [Rubroshorea leprosula]|uniref:Cyclin-dependent protein kinase inhibitor SMR4 n=1 Tax=Rubroshorea leprosula TaxID=152421 RepID=A0AAV5HZ78_9ROSI|nr:hypothetical protein SLEP1_g5759 [Rubroshorea leprosula]
MEEEVYESKDECRTPRREACRIPVVPPCPPAPKKKKEPVYVKRDPPKNGFFQPPELEALFTVVPRKKPCA